MGGRGKGGGTDFKLMLLCVQAVTTKGRQKSREGNSFQVISSVTHTKIKA